MPEVPEISVVLCVYNGERWLREAIDSVLGQTHTDYELVVVDDGSTDSSPEIVRSYDDPRMRMIQHDNRGLAAARNTGAERVRGEFVAYVDADDRCTPERLQSQSAFLRAHHDVAAVGCFVRVIDEDGAELFLQHAPTGRRACRRRLFDGHFYNYGSSLMIRRDTLLAVGGFRTYFRQREDVDFMLRLAERHDIDNVPEVLYEYRINTGGLSHADLRVGFYYRDIAWDLRRERLATGSDRLARGEPIPPFEPHPAEPSVPNDLRRVLSHLHLGEAALLCECGRRRCALGHLARAWVLGGFRPRILRRAWTLLMRPDGGKKAGVTRPHNGDISASASSSRS